MTTPSGPSEVTHLDDRRTVAARRALEELASRDAAGRPSFGLAVSETGEHVLCSLLELTPEGAGSLPRGVRPLDTAERIALAALRQERPVLVVENDAGDHVVLVDRAVDLERHLPLSPEAAALLAENATVRFGRRDDDVFPLTAWSDEDGIRFFEPDAVDFADVPLVSLTADDRLVVERGDVPTDAYARLVDRLVAAEAAPGERHGVFTNPFGEVLCVLEGGPLMPHEDLRRQAVLSISGALDGCDSLPAVIDALRGIAARVEAALDGGWRLSHPVYDDVALVEADP